MGGDVTAGLKLSKRGLMSAGLALTIELLKAQQQHPHLSKPGNYQYPKRKRK